MSAPATAIRPGDLMTLKGPHPDQWVVVLDGPYGVGLRSPDITVAPVVDSVERAAASRFDVMVAPDASGLGRGLVVAAWATGSIPLAYLNQRVGNLSDSPEVVEAIRDVRLALADPSVLPRPEMVGRLDPNDVGVAWHKQVQERMEGYWAGTHALEKVKLAAQLVPEHAYLDWPSALFLERLNVTFELTDPSPHSGPSRLSGTVERIPRRSMSTFDPDESVVDEWAYEIAHTLRIYRGDSEWIALTEIPSYYFQGAMILVQDKSTSPEAVIEAGYARLPQRQPMRVAEISGAWSGHRRGDDFADFVITYFRFRHVDALYGMHHATNLQNQLLGESRIV